MRALSKALLPLSICFALACGGEGSLKRCASKDTALQDCGPGFSCRTPVSGEQGVCVPTGDGDCLVSCATGNVCSDSGDCKPRYLVEITSPAGNSLVGGDPLTVVVKVTRGSSSVEKAKSVTLATGTTTLSAAPQQASVSGTIDTYTWTYAPGSGEDDTVAFTATATGSGQGGVDEKVSSAIVSVVVDDAPPLVQVTPDSGGAFTSTTTDVPNMTFTVKLTDSHPPTGALQATIGTITQSLTYSAADSSAGQFSVYKGVLTPSAMHDASLACGVTVSVSGSDLLGNSGSGSANMHYTCEDPKQVCSRESTYQCKAKYTVTITSAVPSTPISSQTSVTATVVRGTATDVPVPGEVDLYADDAYQAPGTGVTDSANPLITTYSLNYTPSGTNTEGNVNLVAKALVSGVVVATSLAVAVPVDTKSPVVNVTSPSSSSRFLRTDPFGITFDVTDKNYSGVDSITLVPIDGGGNVQSTQSFTVPSPSCGSADGSGKRSCTASLDFSQQTFPYFVQDFTVSVVASDTVGHHGTGSIGKVTITRLRWANTSTAGNADVTTPAVLGDGNLVIGANIAGSVPAVWALDRATGNPIWTTLSSDVGGSVAAPPVVGSAGVWVIGGSPSQLCLIDSSSGRAKTITVGATTTKYCCNLSVKNGNGFAITPTVSGSSTTETATVGGVATISQGVTSGKLYQLQSTGTPPTNCTEVSVGTIGTEVATPPVLDAAGNLYWGDSSRKVYRYPAWTGTNPGVLGSNGVAGALALDSSSVFAVDQPSNVHDVLWKIDATTGAASSWDLGTNAYIAGAWPVVPADNEILIGRQSVSGGNTTYMLGRLRAGSTVGGWLNPSLDGGVRGALVMRDQGGSQTFVVPTWNGSIYQFGSDGTLLWNGSGLSPLHEGNILTEVDTPGYSTAYFGSIGGVVYAVIVDGVLDTNAPWPKVRHDRQNTGNYSHSKN